MNIMRTYLVIDRDQLAEELNCGTMEGLELLLAEIKTWTTK